MMEYYENYLDHIAQTPSEQAYNDTDAKLEYEWDSSHLLATVEEETNIGTFIFNPIEVWKNSVSEYTTNLIKNSKDIRRLLFKNHDHQVKRGLYYRFNDNYWIVTDETYEESVYAEIKVGRCNNMAKWIDEEDILHEVPCRLDYEASSPKPRVDGDIVTPSNGIVMIIQGNKDTVKLVQNKRFIFNGRPFKITGFNNYMEDNYITQDTSFLIYDLYLDEEHIGDDLINEIADRYNKEYKVTILEDFKGNVKGFSGKLNATIMFNNEIIDKSVEWSCNDKAIINQNGNFTLIGDVGDVAIFNADYGGSRASIEIKIIDNVKDNEEIIVTPDISELKQNQSIDITADLYKNGVKQNDILTVEIHGGDSENNYKWTYLSDNKYNLECISSANEPLIITFINGNIKKTISIMLKGIF